MQRNLMTAILLTDSSKIEDLIKNKGVDINGDISMGDTPLVYSIREGKYNSFRKLLELGADINKPVPSQGVSDLVQNNTPLMIASVLEDERFAIDLIKKGADVNAQNTSREKTALMFAYHGDGPEETIRALLDAGSNLELEDKKKQTIIYFAIERAATYDSVGWLEMLFENGRTPNINHQDHRGNTPLIFAINMDNVDVVKFLMSKGPDMEIPNEQGITALLYATSYDKNPETIKLLINSGAKTTVDIDGVNQHALIYMLRSGEAIYNEIIELLLNKGTDVNVVDEGSDGMGDSPLLIAIRNALPIDIIKALVEKGANVNYKNQEGDTPLIESVFDNASIEVVDFLIEKGADVNAQNEEGNTPLLAASMNGYTEIARSLIENGADLNLQSQGGETALIYASLHGNLELAALLLEKGANMNEQDVNGQTPLMFGVLNDMVDFVKLLVEKGADKSIKDESDKTALDYATERGDAEIIALLSDGVESNEEKWKGYTKNDAEFFNPILDNENNLNDQSICPFCLQYTEREANCKYMTHKCTVELRHERLYNLYKNKEGYVVWCAVCGRHCYGHGHFPLTDTKETIRPNLMPFKPGADVYDPKSCPLEGGGGPDEKIKRIDGLLRYICEVQEDVGKRSAKKVRDELIEEAWKAASSRAPKTVRDIRAAKKFNIPCGLPSVAVAEPVAEATTDIPNPNPLPIEKGPGTSSISLDDCDQTYEFVHKQPDGSMFTHQLVCKDDLRDIIRNSGGSEDKCPIEPECKGKLHPEEIKAIFADDEEIYKNYLERFNTKNKVGGTRRKQSRRKTYRNKKFRGGADGTPIISKMSDAICALPEKKTAGRRTYKKKSKSKRSTRRR